MHLFFSRKSKILNKTYIIFMSKLFLGMIMLEWTICTNCGKILDNSKNICPACNEKTEKLGIDFLKNRLANLTFVTKTLDIPLIKDYCPQIKAQNTTLEIIIIDDLFRYFSFLSLSDGVITDRELEFINELLERNYSQDDISLMGEDKLPDVPLSFECRPVTPDCGSLRTGSGQERQTEGPAMLIDDIIPYERNARHNEKAVPVVAESIEEWCRGR